MPPADGPVWLDLRSFGGGLCVLPHIPPLETSRSCRKEVEDGHFPGRAALSMLVPRSRGLLDCHDHSIFPRVSANDSQFAVSDSDARRTRRRCRLDPNHGPCSFAFRPKGMPERRQVSLHLARHRQQLVERIAPNVMPVLPAVVAVAGLIALPAEMK
jgi:hypothetical protein